MKHTIRFIILFLTLLIVGAGNAWSLERSDIIINPVLPNASAGEVKLAEGSDWLSGRTVKIVVTPSSGFKTKKSLIVVEKMIDPANRAPGHRTPDIGQFTLEGTDDWVTSATEYNFTIPEEYDGAYISAKFVSSSSSNAITSLSEITDFSETAYYELAFDIDASSLSESLSEFKGTLDGKFYKIYNLRKPLFTSTDGAIIHNITFEGVDIDVTGNAGAITGEAKGATRIYNCGILPSSTERDTNGNITGFSGSSVGGTGYTGGLVGLLDGTSRVINCYSYATITGGTDVGGIVGYNNVATTAATIAEGTMVMNCMFYGDITGGGNVSPVYGGNNINNVNSGGLATYNYYAYSQLKTKAISDGKYNCALAMEERFIIRFELYRQLLNSNKKLAAIYATGSAANAETKMAKWVLETADKSIINPKPYPILKEQRRYPSIINYDIENAGDSATVGRNHGGKLGRTLSVTISGIGTNAPEGASITDPDLTLYRTDKDTIRYNYNYDKVQLPYYNDVGTGNYTKYRVVTGWKITAITSVADDPYSSTNYDYDQDYSTNKSYFDYPNYNFADRKSSNKDLYSVSGRVFSQGAYFDVPYGVTSITIEPYWATAAYVSDEYYDVVLKADNYNPQKVTQLGKCFSTSKITIDDSEQTVHTTISSALGTLSGASVYDNAVVLVGNLHQTEVPSKGDKPFTMMSVDLDGDNEPDYSMIYHDKNRTTTAPIRFDFLNIPGSAQAQKPNGSILICNAAVFKTRGWFEITNTSLIYFSQFEYENSQVKSGDGGHRVKDNAPLILLGGVFDQFVSTQMTEVAGKTIYIHVGGNAWFSAFGLGTHSDGSYSTPHVPVSVTGGDYATFYLTGTYQPKAKVRQDNAECYISGGRFGEAAGASQEQIEGNVTWQIYDADITDFFGGGVNAANPITGNIEVNITNSHVTTYCGGPKFGDMGRKGVPVASAVPDYTFTPDADRTVVTTATGCTFGKYFGAGNGGNSYLRLKYWDQERAKWKEFSEYEKNYINDKGKYFDGNTTNAPGSSTYGKKGPGVAADFDYEFFIWTSGTTGKRFYVKFVTFSQAKTNDVNSNLTNCTVTGNFYGGGNLGTVLGTATSVLDDCTVQGSVYGGGYSASIPTVDVRDGGFSTYPNINDATGMFEPGEKTGTTKYEWMHVDAMPANGQPGTKDGKYIYTDVDLTSLGEVANTNLTITGSTTVAKSVYGGGEESSVGGNTTVSVNSGTIGAQGPGGAEYGNVYGGGKGAEDNKTAGLVKGNTNVTISQAEGKTTRIYHNVYGGGAYGSVGDFTYDETSGMPTSLKTENTGATTVTITGGTFGIDGHENGMVFGSSRGEVATPVGTPAVDPNDLLAWVYNTHVNIGTEGSATGPTIKGSVYGSGENGHTLNNTELNIYSGTIGIADPNDKDGGASYGYRGNVYGGGCGTDMYDSDDEDDVEDSYNPLAGIVRGTTTINISGGHVVRNVYGAGAIGSVGGGTTTDAGKTTINVTGGRIGYDGNSNNDGCIFGAARGEYGVSVAGSNLANVRETEVNINYGTTPAVDDEDKTVQLITGSVFGGGEAGTVEGSVTVNMTGGLILKDVYGGGALADTQTSNWDPTANENAGDWADGKFSASATTTVRLTGGRVGEEVFGGALGETGTELNPTGKPAYVWGDVLVDVNGTTTMDPDGKPTTAGAPIADTAKGCIVGKIFGCNNANGTPKGDVMVHVFATQNAAATQIANTNGETPVTDAKVLGRYDVVAVYGGGNEAAYDPVAPTVSKTQVIIEGCSETSIETVYGGGNAAAVPETNVDIKAAFEIGYLFGGGNGKDATSYGENPGADVGTLDHGTTTYGTGNANTLMEGGLIHEAYGGSNQKGIIKGSINQITDPDGSSCELIVEKIVGAGKYADIDGDVNMTLSCQPDRKVNLLFAGADEANVNGNITLNITNGHFGKVFGGNNLGGAIKGKITVNVEETGCQPIKIDDLYLGSNEAAYSVYGYYESEDPVTGKKILKPRTSADDSHTPVDNPATDETHTFPYAQPELNIISCTYIGNVFGGGFGKGAIMYANPTVNVNMVPGDYANDETVGVPKVMTDLGLAATENPDHLGIIRNVYGGGDAADIEGNTTVNIATEDGKSAYIIGSIFGGGNAADVLGNTNVTMSGGYVFNGVFGGGYAGNVGTFTRSFADADVNVFGHTTHEGCIGKPTACAEGTGKCTVVVDGGQIGPIEVATEGMTRASGPVPEGWVWGAGQGLVEDPAEHPDTHFTSYVGSTDVTIDGTALIMESIIGGGEFGRVLGNTLVKIEGGQIGVGAGKVDTNNKPIRYTDDQFVNPLTTTITNDNALVECSHFPYGEDTNNDGIKDTFLPYDPYYDTFKDTDYIKKDHPDLSPASTASPSDGKTWIGCVFAGGSGYMPYLKKDNNGNPVGYDWCSSAGLVEGNTELIISGGHILTNVYGGNEVTNVKGKCKITMTGGTIGVPRTVDQIIAHPLSCYLFGAGKGDQRPHFNTETNVGEVEINISGGIIYGSVFGGGEDGHVQRDVNLTIEKGEDFTIGGTTYSNGPVIGTWGTSYVDGNVFGGGRGFGGDAYTAGNVAGSVDVKIKGGNILGSIYGGGRLGSVGYGLYPPTAGDEYYGAMRPDNTDDDAGNSPVSDFKRGYVDIEISGGTIGNRHEYIIPSEANTPTGLSFAGIATWTDANWTTWKNHNNIPLTEFDKATYRLKHTKGGNVFAGGMGRLYQLDGKTPITSVDWWKLGCVKSTKLTIKGGTIKSCVYGGGELGQVVGFHTTQNAANEEISAGTEIIIQNSSTTTPTIGTEIQSGSGSDAATQYTFGSVFGGGYGSLQEGTINNEYPKLIAGLVKEDTKIDMKAGEVKASIYGGGEMASVGESTTSGETTTATGSTYVAVSGGTIGIAPITVSDTKRYFGGATMGNVYGGGSGHGNTVRSGKIFKNTNVTISGSNTRIYHNIYGGGAYGTVGDFDYDVDGENKVTKINSLKAPGGVATITITGGTIGYDGKNNGMVFGSSRGDINAPGKRDDYTAWVYDTHVTIGETNGSTNTPLIKGSVYGSGENGHTYNDAAVTIHSGTIGVHDGTAADGTRGNVYGAGCGTDKYYENPSQETHDGDGQLYNPKAGIVQGTATVTINGGHVLHNVYGAGAMGPVGIDGVGHKTTVNINGGRIGYDGNDNGNVYGGARGDQGIERNFAYVGDTEVNINYTATPSADNEGKTEKLIAGSVFGGGEAGSVHGGIVVNMNKGLVLNDVYGGGALADTNTDNWGSTTWADAEKKSALYTTAVNLTGGKVIGNVYGGGLGRIAASTKPAIEAKVYGNTTVELNKDVPINTKGCIVLSSIFGCNNLNGTPMGDVLVHIHATQNDATANIETKTSEYDVDYVFGGGNKADYVPATDNEKQSTEVIIEGCALTSIKEVYGGGYGAATPGTKVEIRGTHIIDNAFGGGYGAGTDNPGANVGYRTGGTTPYGKTGSDVKTAVVRLMAGKVNNVYGGSNTRGDIRGGSSITNVDKPSSGTGVNQPCCDDLKVGNIYGGGKDAEMEGGTEIILGCMPNDWIEEIYAGAENADVGNDVSLTLTSGKFGRVFGGNKTGGRLNGGIVVNIEENGTCGTPIIIGELYGGGNEAPYSIYGYKNEKDANGKWIPREKSDYDAMSDAEKEAEGIKSKPHESPVVNVRAFTSIGNIYGGGLGTTAVMVGSPTVNINEVAFDKDVTGYQSNAYNPADDSGKPSWIGDGENQVKLYPHEDGKMGVIGNVFGGGNAARIIGNTNVNIGTENSVKFDSLTDITLTGNDKRVSKPVVGADIRNNVYGGGNNAEVTGNTNVTIGEKKVSEP